MEPLISVIVPVYKVEKYLRQCVDSICNQTYVNLEIILVDDGSPDNSPKICDEYAEKDSRVRVIHKQNGGLSDARNAGMAICQGAYLSFVDSDDVLPNDALERMVKLALDEDADLVIGENIRFEDILPDKVKETFDFKVMSKTEAMEDFFQNGCAAWARLFKREIHEGLLFPFGEINEDEAIVLQLLNRCSIIVKTSRPVYFYRCRIESITTSSFSKKKLDWVKHCQNNLCFIKDNYPVLTNCAATRYMSSLLWALWELAVAGENETGKELKKELIKNRCLFSKCVFDNYRARITYAMHMIMPFRVYQAIILLWRKI